MKQSLLFALVYFFVLNSCGFKVANFQQNFSINEINSIGIQELIIRLKINYCLIITAMHNI